MKKLLYLLFILLSLTSSAQNLILNDGFEASHRSSIGNNPNEFLNNFHPACAGDIQHWYSSHGSPNLTADHVNSGISSAQMQTVQANGIKTSEGIFQKNLNLIPGVKYTLVFHYYLWRDNTNIPFPGLSVNVCSNLDEEGVCPGFSTGNPNTIQTKPSQNIFTLNPSNNGPTNLIFITQTVTFIANSNYNNLQFYSLNSSASYPNYHGITYVDDICLTSPCCEVSKVWQNITDDPTNLSVPSSLKNTRVTDFISAGAQIQPANQGNVIHNHSTKLIFQADHKINLKQGFYVKEGSPFKANLLGCNNDFWVNLQYIVNNCDITLWCNPCGGCGSYSFEWKDIYGNVLTTPSPYTFLHVGIITENKTYSVTVTDQSSGQTYTESITVGPCGCLKPVGPPATTITICSATDACQEIGIARIPKMTYSWTTSDANAQSFISSTNTSFTKICIPESYRNLSNLKIYLSITNECNDVVITQYDFACCPVPQLSTVNIDICNNNYYELGPQNWTNFYGYTFQWTATNQADLSLLSNQTISNPTITLNPNNIPNFPLHYTLIGTNACGISFAQDYILDGVPQAPIVHFISPGYCWDATLQTYVLCNPYYHSSTQTLEVPYLLTDPANTTINYKQLIVEVYNGGTLVGNPRVFNADDANMISKGNSDPIALTFIKNSSRKLNIPINLNCNQTIGVIIYYRRDCDIFPIYGFNNTNNTLCTY